MYESVASGGEWGGRTSSLNFSKSLVHFALRGAGRGGSPSGKDSKILMLSGHSLMITYTKSYNHIVFQKFIETERNFYRDCML